MRYGYHLVLYKGTNVSFDIYIFTLGSTLHCTMKTMCSKSEAFQNCVLLFLPLTLHSHGTIAFATTILPKWLPVPLISMVLFTLSDDKHQGKSDVAIAITQCEQACRQ